VAKDRTRKMNRYLVALTERYEVEVVATTRTEAIEKIAEFGGNSPVWSRVTAKRIAGPTDEHTSDA